MAFCCLTSPFFLHCHKPQYNSFKIVFDLQLIKAIDLQMSQSKNIFYKERTCAHLELKETKNIGIQTIAPRGKLPPDQDWGLGLGQGKFQGWGATRQLPRGKFPPGQGQEFWLGLVFGLGGNFPRGQFSQNQKHHTFSTVKGTFPLAF